MSKKKKSFEERLKHFPELTDLFEKLLSQCEETVGDEDPEELARLRAEMKEEQMGALAGDSNFNQDDMKQMMDAMMGGLLSSVGDTVDEFQDEEFDEKLKRMIDEAMQKEEEERMNDEKDA
ncbi:hypothetical protein SCG7109_AP_00140 [Chlamydiales bacterium SCGC AG-110-M15]|nr:hypothetical protein SCG7109_AP_00140 [Chlamydiales bacterium SCGC AG-110-M15]